VTPPIIEGDHHRMRQVVASVAPAVMWTVIGCPFDVIKTRMQTATTPFSGPLHCLAWTLRREGGRALWKGFIPQLLTSSPYSMIMFSVYQLLKPVPSSSGGSEWGHIGGCFLAGSTSGIAVTFLHNPMEVWRVRVQTHLQDQDSSRKDQKKKSSVVLRLLKNPLQLGRGS